MEKKEAMDKKRQYLKRYESMLKSRDDLIDKKNELISKMENAKAAGYGRMPHGKNEKPRDLSDYMMKLDECYEDISKAEDEMEQKREEYINMFRALEENEAEVMRKRYIEIKAWKTIADEMSKSRAQVNRYHDSAMEKIIEREKENGKMFG